MKWLRAYGTRIVSGLSISAVAGVAGIVSYTHIYELTLTLHQSRLTARLMPFAVDGLIVIGSVVLLDTPVEPQRRRFTPRLGWLGVGPGVAISLYANIESGIQWGWRSAAWAGVASASFFVATFLLERWIKAQATRAAGTRIAQPAAQTAPHIVPELSALAARTAPDPIEPPGSGAAQTGTSGNAEGGSDPSRTTRALTSPAWGPDAYNLIPVAPPDPDRDEPGDDPFTQALKALRRTTHAGNPLSGRQLVAQYGVSRGQLDRLKELVPAGSRNGGTPEGN